MISTHFSLISLKLKVCNISSASSAPICSKIFLVWLLLFSRRYWTEYKARINYFGSSVVLRNAKRFRYSSNWSNNWVTSAPDFNRVEIAHKASDLTAGERSLRAMKMFEVSPLSITAATSASELHKTFAKMNKIVLRVLDVPFTMYRWKHVSKPVFVVK